MLKRLFPSVVLVLAIFSVAAVNPTPPRIAETDTLTGFCRVLQEEGIGVHPGLKQMDLEFSLLRTNFNRMKAARAEATAVEATDNSVALKADVKARAFESERAYRDDVSKFAAKFVK